MFISIIIPAFNEELLLQSTLAAVNQAGAAFRQRGWAMEIIVCDNNSSDGTAALARAAGAKVVFEPVNQISRARNAGAAAAQGDWLLFVDADSKPSRGLFEDVAAQIETGRCLAGGATVCLDDDSPAARFGTGFWNFLSRRFRLLAGSFIFCESAAFRQVGGFSLELFAGEELDLSEKLKRQARKTRKRVVILHLHPLLTSARKIRLYRRAELMWFFAKAALRRETVLRSREHCSPWYDGRR